LAKSISKYLYSFQGMNVCGRECPGRRYISWMCVATRVKGDVLDERVGADQWIVGVCSHGSWILPYHVTGTLRRFDACVQCNPSVRLHYRTILVQDSSCSVEANQCSLCLPLFADLPPFGMSFLVDEAYRYNMHDAAEAILPIFLFKLYVH
jgi:hypothetical protein